MVFCAKGNRLKNSRPESQMTMQEVKLAVLHLQGMFVAFLLGAVPAEPGAQGAGPQLVAALPSPEQVPAVLPALCPSLSAEVAVLQHDQTLPPAAEPPASLTATSLCLQCLQPSGNAVGFPSMQESTCQTFWRACPWGRDTPKAGMAKQELVKAAG